MRFTLQLEHLTQSRNLEIHTHLLNSMDQHTDRNDSDENQDEDQLFMPLQNRLVNRHDEHVKQGKLPHQV